MLPERSGADDVTDAASQPNLQGAAVQPGSQSDAEPGAPGADIAHELADLLMIVSGSLEQLRRQPLNTQGQQQLARAEWGARQVARLMLQVLSQGGDGAAAVVDLNEAVAGFTAIMGRHAGEDVPLTADLSPVRLPVRMDAGLLELVLLNLVRNAAGAVPDGGTITLQTKGPRFDGLGDQFTAEVSVLDDGPGVADATFTPDGRGAGLGLWMAHRFASIFGGKVSVEAVPGCGTSVHISLPYAGDADPG